MNIEPQIFLNAKVEKPEKFQADRQTSTADVAAARSSFALVPELLCESHNSIKNNN